jgi:hypothetical protein
MVDVVSFVFVLLVPDHLIEGLGVEDGRVVEVCGVDGDVDWKVEEGEDDLNEVEGSKLVVLANLLRKLRRVDSEIQNFCFFKDFFNYLKIICMT